MRSDQPIERPRACPELGERPARPAPSSRARPFDLIAVTAGTNKCRVTASRRPGYSPASLTTASLLAARGAYQREWLTGPLLGRALWVRSLAACTLAASVGITLDMKVRLRLMNLLRIATQALTSAALVTRQAGCRQTVDPLPRLVGGRLWKLGRGGLLPISAPPRVVFLQPARCGSVDGQSLP